MDKTDEDQTLEPLDVEVRSATVVLSVRLDDATARRLRSLARQRGVRISDILREAADSIAAQAPPTRMAGMPYDVAYLNTAFTVEPVERTVSPVTNLSVDNAADPGPFTGVSALARVLGS